MHDLLLISFLAALALAAVVAAIVLTVRNRALRRQAAERAERARLAGATTRGPGAAAAPLASRPPVATPARPAATPAPAATTGSPRRAPQAAEPAPPRPAAVPCAMRHETRPVAALPPGPAARPDFEVTRPFDLATESLPTPARAPIAAPAPVVARRVLVVDDSAVVRAKLGKLLAARGWAVASARHGLHAIEVLEREGADLLITDLEMPEMDGRALIAALAGQPLPVLAITGHETPPAPATLGGSVRGVLRKPWDEGELLAAVEAASRSSRRLLVH